MEENRISVVTGANGFVGSHLVDLLLEKGHKVRCIVRKSSNLRWLENKNVEIYDCGLFDKDGLKNVLKDADYLFHVAGVVKAKNEEGYRKGNVETTKNLLDVILDVNHKIKRVIIVSSQTAAGPNKLGEHVNENTIPHPITRYGKSKLEQENLAKTYMDKIPISIVRAPAVFGERDTEIYLVFRTYKKMRLMTLIGFNRKELSLIYVKDLVKGIYLSAITDKAANETFFIGSEKQYTWQEIGKIIAKVFGQKALTLRIPHSIVFAVAAVAQFFSYFSKNAATFNIEKAKDFVQEAWTMDISKAKNDLNFREDYTLEEALTNTISWYRDNKWL